MFLEIPFEKIKKNTVFIDVRSEGEYDEAHIPGAVNIPLFRNEERRIIGTAYKNESVSEARKLGIQFASARLPQIYEMILSLKDSHERQLIAYCARGGYRSTFFASAFSSIGVGVLKLDGGYKRYRNYIIENLPKLNNDLNYIVLHGNTGTGKTKILKSLKNHGLDVLDLEGAANHRGSVLGSVGLGPCNNQKQFESNIFHQMQSYKTQNIFVEAESRKIGNVLIPGYIHEKMKTGVHILIEEELDYRVQVIKDDYTQKKDYQVEILQSLSYLKKYMSKEKLNILSKSIQEGNISDAISDLMVNYYDPLYTNKSDKYDYQLTLSGLADPEKTALAIEEWLDKEGK
ncbi:MAG: tRNA 2-selenouridine(34) synthase MnmH [Dethiosulfatibacter sp.]|nr:tRNA 2-selenouridine(34) synthase MnmH [Dethiosulfatibacter sp.]